MPGALVPLSPVDQAPDEPLLSVFAVRDAEGRSTRLTFTGQRYLMESLVPRDGFRPVGEICSAVQFGLGSAWTLIGSIAAAGDGNDPYVIAALSSDGRPRWVWRSESRAVRTLAPLVFDGRSSGFIAVLAGELALHRFDVVGNLVSVVPDDRAAMTVATHDRLPGVVLRVGGGYSLIRLARDTTDVTVLVDGDIGASLKRRPLDARLWIDLGVLTPGEGDTPDGAILAGTAEPMKAPILVRIDLLDNELWRVQLPARAVGLAGITLPDGGTMICLSTSDGVAYLLDGGGALLDAMQLGEPASGGGGVRSPIAAGVSSPDRGWMFVRTRSGAELMGIDIGMVERWRRAR